MYFAPRPFQPLNHIMFYLVSVFLIAFITTAQTTDRDKYISGPNWLHQWKGTYYNGTVELMALIPRHANCEKIFGSTAWMRDLDATLFIGPAQEFKNSEDDAAMVLVVWHFTKVLSTQWRYTPESFNAFVSPEVLAIFSSSRYIFNEPTEPRRAWTVKARNTGAEEFSIAGTFIDNQDDISRQSDNYFNTSLASCRKSSDTLIGLVNNNPFNTTNMIPDPRYIPKWLNSTIFSGSFSPASAKLTYLGFFDGHFVDNHSPSKSILPGLFNITFEGKVDGTNSDKLVVGSEVFPEWETIVKQRIGTPEIRNIGPNVRRVPMNFIGVALGLSMGWLITMC